MGCEFILSLSALKATTCVEAGLQPRHGTAARASWSCSKRCQGSGHREQSSGLRFQYRDRPNLDFRGFEDRWSAGTRIGAREIVSVTKRPYERVKSITTFDGDRESRPHAHSGNVVLEDELGH